MASAQSNGSPYELVPSATNRTAINSSERLGALYDGYKDVILGQVNMNIKGKVCQVFKSTKCVIKNGSKDRNENILKMMGVEDELRLSVLLNTTERNGVAGIIDYSHSINDYTRFFYYSYLDQEEQLSDYLVKTQVFDVSSKLHTSATHIITGIRTGIDVIVVLQMPSCTEIVQAIDQVLHRIRSFLLTDHSIFTPSVEEENLLGSIIHTKIYSNIPNLCRMNTLGEVCRYIQRNKNSSGNYPVLYTLRRIKSQYSNHIGQLVTFISLPKELNGKIERYVRRLKNDITKLEHSISVEVPRLLCGYLKEQISRVQKQLSDIEKEYTNEIKRLSKLVTDIRSGRVRVPTVNQALENNQQILLKNSIHELSRNLRRLKRKGQLITDLKEQQFQYYNVADHDIDRTDNERTIERKLVRDDRRDCVLCSSDALNKTKQEEIHKLRRDLVEKLENNSKLRLIYADFSYCSFELQNMIKLPSNKYANEQNRSTQTGTTVFRTIPTTNAPFSETQSFVVPSGETQTFASILPSTEAQTRVSTSTIVRTSASMRTNAQTILSPRKPLFTTPLSTRPETDIVPKGTAPTYAPSLTGTGTFLVPPRPLPDNEIINILLLGETGVGKSTFINAFANYLTFNTLQQAEIGKPVVLIPVSFLITVGDNFEERIVKFGSSDISNNEDFDHPGQSVTQLCKSYEFHLNGRITKKLRIIDTPGFGDTRGLDQDDRNMQHILQYIKGFSHLNAICFLLKPNESRLNISFRSCLAQLFSLLGSNISNNIIFCFTNSRSTFYTPGNTAPLLRKVLASLPMTDVPFKKDNTFCFDSESFRYLVAIQNKIRFDHHQKKEYETSWTNSVTEVNRLVRYIRENLIVYCMPTKR
jgi:GTPase SAR1 family protein